MILNADYDTWKPFFAILPRRMPDGSTALLHHIWRKRVKGQGDFDYFIYSYYDKTEEEDAKRRAQQLADQQYRDICQNYFRFMKYSEAGQGTSATSSHFEVSLTRDFDTSNMVVICDYPTPTSVK